MSIRSSAGLRVLRVAHHAPVSAWRERERIMRSRGADVTLISSQRWNEGGAIVTFRPGEDAFVVPVRTFGSHPNLFAYDPRPLWSLLGRQWDVLDLHEEPCSVAVAEVLLIRWLRRRAMPFVLYSAQNIPKRYPFPFRLTECLALRGAAAAYVCNTEAARILVSKGLLGPAVVIPLGLDARLHHPQDRQPPKERLTVGYAGRLAKHKGVDLAIRAIVGRSAWTLRVAGAGSERNALAELSGRLGVADRVQFVGSLTQEELPDFYRSLDVLLVPSVPIPGWLEQFGRVATEAMACGVPVVSSDCGALPEVVGASAVVPAGDVDALRGKVDELTDPKTWSERRLDALQRSQAYSWDAVVEAHLNLLQDAAKAKPTRTRRTSCRQKPR